VKLTVDRNEFAETVAWCSRFLPARVQGSQALAGLLLEADDGLTVSGFDFETAAKGQVSGAVTSPGRCLVHGRLLADVTRNLPAAPVFLELDGSRLTLTCGPARFAFPTMAVEDYPALPELPAAIGEVEASLLAEASAQVTIAAGVPGKGLAILSGVRIEMRDDLALVALDERRGGHRVLDWTSRGSADVTVSARQLADTVRALDGQVTIGADLFRVGFSTSTRSVVLRLMTEQYPDWRKLFTGMEYPVVADFDLAELAAAVKMVRTVVSGLLPVVFHYTADQVSITGGTAETADGGYTVPVTYNGPEARVGYNPQYLLAALSVIDSDVVSFQYRTDDPAQFAKLTTRIVGKDDTYRHLVAPVRLS
jgi:DNA polymerase-3 subunit beta